MLSQFSLTDPDGVSIVSIRIVSWKIVRFSAVIGRLGRNIRLLFLIGLANGAPVLAKKLLGARFSLPVDSGTTAPDHQAFFGSSKTLRGVLLSVLLTALAGWSLGFPFGKAALIGSGAMVGDLFSSFCKRRLRLPTSSKALGLDQVPESPISAFALQKIALFGRA